MFHTLLPHLTDVNSKVVALLGDLLLPIVTSIVEPLVPNLTSKPATIRNTAETVLELIIQCISK